MPIMKISVIPLGTKTASVSKYIAGALKILKNQRQINFRLTTMDTIVEADSVDRLLNIARKMHNAVLKREIKRVVTTITIDDRRDKKLTIEGKIRAVERKMRG
ncbi:MAG: MTH1187 family thiamine-binding protein [Candidatus Omnitrophota bacterium]|nr:MTH1187 family thiamine-binding protein [Candidatus Omnitrophota bacterium]